MPTDDKASAEKSKRVLLGKRVTVFWDKDRTLSQWFHKNGLAPIPKQRDRRLFRGGFLWDCYLLYDRKAKWNKNAPKPVVLDGAVIRKKKPLLDSLRIAAKELGKADETPPCCKPDSPKSSKKKARLY